MILKKSWIYVLDFRLKVRLLKLEITLVCSIFGEMLIGFLKCNFFRSAYVESVLLNALHVATFAMANIDAKQLLSKCM